MDDTTPRPDSPSSSRRAVLAAAVGGVGAWAAAAIGRTAPVQAANGDIVNVGDNLNGTATTTFNVSTPGFSALWGNSTAGSGVSVGLRGDAASGSIQSAGVLGNASNGDGIRGTGNNGVMGVGFSRGVFGQSAGVGVVGIGGDGVRGDATSTGVGVSGKAGSASGYAFRGSGRVRFDKVSGVSTIPAGATSVTVTPGVDITADSFVLLTAKANIGSRSLYYRTDATNNRFTIRISSSRPSSTAVAWLLMR